MGLIEDAPRGWGEDELSQFAEASWNNFLATFDKLPLAYDALKRVDDLFVTATTGLKDPSHPLSALFLLRTHSMLRAAFRLALSGQLPETYPLLRAALEMALYALAVAEDENLARVWFTRHESEEARKAVRAAFSVGKLFGVLRARDEALCGTVRQLYERTIDLGGHPNERAITTNLERRETEDCVVFDSNFLTRLDTDWGSGCLKSCAEAGVATLKVFEFIFADKFREGGISAVLARYRPTGGH